MVTSLLKGVLVMNRILKIVSLLMFIMICCCACFDPEPFSFTLNEDETGYILEKYYDYSSGAQADVIIPESYQGLPVVEIGTGAFVGNRDLVSVIIPEGVSVIDGNAFANCDHLASVVFPSTLTKIGESAFDGCVRLSEIEILQAVDIGRCAFEECGLVNVSIGNDEDEAVFRIGYAAFEQCANLKRVVLGSGCVSIGEQAFAKSGLQEIYLPNSLEKIDTCAFEKCVSLSDIYFDGTTEEWLDVYFAPWWTKDAGHYQDHTKE